MPETTRTVDILVLGATVAGLTTAVEAARAGASVIVVDLAEATRFGTGLVTVAHGPRLRDVELHRGLPAVERLIAETLRGIEWLRQNLPAHGVELTPRTAYSIAVDGHLAFHLRHEARLLRRGSVTVDMTDEQPLAPLETRPPLVFADQAQVDPHRHRDALLAAARSAGVDRVGGATLGRFTPGQPWRVTFEVAGATHVFGWDAVHTALEDFGRKASRQEHIDPHAVADALIANERARSPAVRQQPKSLLEADLADLVLGGIESVWKLLKR